MQPLTISALQTSTVWHDPAANRSHFESLLADVAADVDLVLLPEMFSTGFTMASADVAEPADGPTVQWMCRQSRALGKVLCGSVVIESGGRFFNRLVWAVPDGEPAFYDKRHLFRMADEHQHYCAGEQRLVVRLGGWRVCPVVCYDLRFPVWLRNRDDYDVLICVANWPAARRDAWNTLLRARAIENQVYCAGLNIVGEDGNGVLYSGGTGVYGPDGAVLEELFDAPGVVTVSLDAAHLARLRADFPVAADADEFELR